MNLSQLSVTDADRANIYENVAKKIFTRLKI